MSDLNLDQSARREHPLRALCVGAVKIRHNIADVRRQFRDLTRSQVPFATALALNDTAADAKLAAEAGLEADLDRPTPFTRRGLYQARASKSRLAAAVGVRPIQAGYLRFQIKGGERAPRRRAILVPKGARLNQFGNMPRRAVAGYLRRADVFVAGGGDPRGRHLRPGIYQRLKGRSGAGELKLLVAFASRAQYGKRFDMRRAVLTRAAEVYRAHFRRRLGEALRTAR